VNQYHAVKRLIILVPVILAALVLTARGYSNYVVQEASPGAAATSFSRAMHGGQLSVADVDEMALLLKALPRFAQHVPSPD